ncbi:MAG: SpoIID/LytB protein [Thermoleophilia bacterium]|nr:SpoIID/LytB protein [Thermoleophilia bacterium]
MVRTWIQDAAIPVPMLHPMRNAGRNFLTALCALVTLASLGAASASAKVGAEYRLEGRGWGHGIGMSQYGANGYAKRGMSGTEIIQHYYSGTVVAPRPADGPTDVRVLLQSQLAPARVELTSAGLVTQGSATLPLVAGDIVEMRNQGLFLIVTRVRAGAPNATLATASAADATIVPEVDGSVRALFSGDYASSGTRYRGTIVGHRYDGKVSVVNTVPFESYVRGVVGDEMPPSWHAEALKAQAIAARAYALKGIRTDYDWFDLYSDTRSQVYGGVGAEDSRTDAAIAATAGLVARVGDANGEVATTYFYSTSAGRTAANEQVWGGSPRSYLRSVASPYEDSQYFLWKGADVKRYTPAQLGAKLGYSGSFKAASNTLWPSGYAKEATIATTQGAKILAASTVQSRLGLRSTYFRISYLSIGAPDAVATGGYARIAGRIPRTGLTNLVLTQNGVSRTLRLRPAAGTGAFVVRARVAGTLTATFSRAGLTGPSITVAAT